MWLPIHTAPFDAEIELAVIDRGGPHALIFPCRLALQGWKPARNSPSIPLAAVGAMAIAGPGDYGEPAQ
jgi:hypothetical protein